VSSTTKVDRELSEQAKAEVAALRKSVTDLEDDLLDKLIVRVQDLHLELMYLKDTAVAVRDLRTMRRGRD
jgi:hypothetical protein